MKHSTKKLLTTVGLSSATLLMGLTLNSQVSKAAVQVSDTQVQVEAGDTYKSIAESNSLTVAQLEIANGRQVGGFDLIFPGETITLPAASNNTQTQVQDSTNTTNTDNSQAQVAQTTTDTSSTATPAQQVQTNNYSGTKLSSSAGTITGPSGKETYYNLDMSGVVSNAQAQGINGSYWVRNDGVKMLGDYVMVAANRNVHPQGSIVQTTLGSGVVVDTGEFSISSPQDLDIAVNW